MRIKGIIFIAIFSNLILAQNNDMNNGEDYKNLDQKSKIILSSFQKAEKYLALRVYPKDFFNDTLLMNMVYQDRIENLLTVLVLNLEEGIKTISKNEISLWNRNEKEIFEIAKSNTQNLIKNEPPATARILSCGFK